MNFDEMNGYDFENYISRKLKDAGFEITQTAYSNDGGIDIIAYYSKPLFSGTYIIQCKKWAGNVGQPEMRDLYGVVMSERANKGILITTSDFTQQARDFAAGKNLELINGYELTKLFPNDETDIDVSTNTVQSLDPDFNYERYEYLLSNYKKKERYSENKLDYFIWESFWNGHLKACKLLDLINLSIDINTYRLKKAKKREAIKVANVSLFNAYLILGQFDKAANVLLETNSFYLNCWTPREKLDDKSGSARLPIGFDEEVYCPRACARNLYTVFKIINYKNGLDAMLDQRIESKQPTWAYCKYSFDYLWNDEIFQFYTDLEKERFLNGEYDGVLFKTSSSIKGYDIGGIQFVQQGVNVFVDESINYSKSLQFNDIKEIFFPEYDKQIEKKLNAVLRRQGIL